jgi:DNA (cytosine-5)-methyltransferase 1
MDIKTKRIPLLKPSVATIKQENLQGVLEFEFTDSTEPPQNNIHNQKITFSDICAGIGGFRVGLESIGGKCIYSCEIEPECETTYQANYGEKFNAHDVHNIVSEEFPHVDILCGGFPCQPFSIAGKRDGFNDKRGNVFFKIAEIIEISRPNVVFLENVPNLVAVDKGQTFKAMLKHLDAIGYDAYYDILDSAEFGVPQARKRVYVVAFLKSLGIKEFSFTKKTSKRVGFRDFIESEDRSIPISDKWHSYIDLYTGKIGLDEIGFDVPKTRRKLERADANVTLDDCVFQMRSSGIRAVSIDKPLPTFAVSISGGGAMIPVYSKERRHLNLMEMKRLMGFPDNFEMPVSRTHAIKQLANAVCPPVIKSIGLDILRTLKEHSISQ